MWATNASIADTIIVPLLHQPGGRQPQPEPDPRAHRHARRGHRAGGEEDKQRSPTHAVTFDNARRWGIWIGEEGGAGCNRRWRR